jgi:hypothetical protein
MKRVSRVLAVLAVLLFAGASAAQAYHINGYVKCDSIPVANAVVTYQWGPFSGSVTTDSTGYYVIDFIGWGGTGDVTLILQTTNLPPGSTFVSPLDGKDVLTIPEGQYATDNVNFLLGNCEGKCWMTGGGQKIEPITGLALAERGPKHSFGGNVYPGCSPDAGDGGSWNHVAHTAKLHFHGQQITIVRCGNVSGIPPGSTSPVTPYNFIEFTGTGTLVGIKGNKADHGTVYFFARVEDRNEPGNEGATAGALVDRYMIRVYSDPEDPAGSTLLVLDDGAGQPVPITHGNLQLHISSCSPAPTR